MAEEPARPRWRSAGRVWEWAGRSIALWVSLFGVFLLASCGGGGSSPEEIRACLNDAGLDANPLAAGETERDDFGVKDEIRINLGEGRGATVYIFDSDGDASSFTELPAPGIAEQYGDMSFYVGPGIPEKDVDAIRGCLEEGS